MTHSLDQQGVMARGYMGDHWPDAERQAREIPFLYENKFEDVLIFGCGDSYYAALAIEHALSEWTPLRARAAPSMTAGRYLIPRYYNQGIKPLVIGISSSGEVSRTIEALELGIEIGGSSIAISNAKEGRLAQTAHHALVLEVPTLPVGPGLLSYLASVMSGFAIASANVEDRMRKSIQGGLQKLIAGFDDWYHDESERAKELAANRIKRDHPCVFIGSGPAYGSALFASAKLVEAAGMSSWANELEEWSHIEYFCEPPDMVTWILSASGRASSRELEVRIAAESIGRNVIFSQWSSERMSPDMVETLSPLALWVGPAAFASQLADIFNESPFRDFGGGRDREGGGGISRIRTSKRFRSISELLERT